MAIEVHTASFRTIRGYTVVAAILDELAFWPTDDAADPDAEIIAALRPAMATVPNAMLLCLSSPYARKGELWRAHRDHFGRDGDVLVVQAPTRALNPTVPEELVERAMVDDEPRAPGRVDAQFRIDVESFVSREVVEAATVPGRVELPPVRGVSYSGFTDPSGGSQRMRHTGNRPRGGRPHHHRRDPRGSAPVQSRGGDRGVLRRAQDLRLPRVVGDRYARRVARGRCSAKPASSTTWRRGRSRRSTGRRSRF